MIFLACNEAAVIFLGYLKISWTDPTVCLCLECPHLGQCVLSILVPGTASVVLRYTLPAKILKKVLFLEAEI